MKKDVLEKVTLDWLKDRINKTPDINLSGIFLKKNLSTINHSYISNHPLIAALDFTCDITAIIQYESSKKFDLILINRYSKSIGIREIGEMRVISNLVNPYFSAIISPTGHSSVINNIVVNEQISNELFSYSNKHFYIFSIDNQGEINKESIIPANFRSVFPLSS